VDESHSAAGDRKNVTEFRLNGKKNFSRPILSDGINYHPLSSTRVVGSIERISKTNYSDTLPPFDSAAISHPEQAERVEG